MEFKAFHEKHGRGVQVAQPPPSCDMLPMLSEIMRDEWREYGLASYMEGVFWTVNPFDFRPALEVWLPEWHRTRSVEVFARTAFGDLLVLRNDDGRESVGCVSVQYGRYSVLGSSVRRFFDNRLTDRRFVAIGLVGRLTSEARAQHGDIEADEMFTFVPALPLGGVDTLENVQKVKMMPQLDLLGQLYDKLDFQS